MWWKRKRRKNHYLDVVGVNNHRSPGDTGGQSLPWALGCAKSGNVRKRKDPTTPHLLLNILKSNPSYQ